MIDNKKTKFRGFTLVELLAVIVILAIILVIAVPQIMKTIESARLGAFQGTAKLILTQAEKQYLVDQTLNIDGAAMTDTTYEGTGEEKKEGTTAVAGCGKLAKLGSDYDECKVTVDGDTGVATLETLTGTGKFANYSCTGTTLSNVESVCNKSGSSSSESGSGSGGGQASTPTGAETLIASCTGTCLTGTPNADGLFKDENGDYRYTGATVANYATFNNETWRIVGIFDGRIKLMRDAVIGSDKWYPDTSSGNAWAGSAVELGLNGDYLTSTGYLGSSLSSDAQNLIDNADWYTTAITNAQNTASAYTAEHTGTPISRKVGLIYPSDYGYASSECYNDSTKKLYNSRQANSYLSDTCKNSNWMYTNTSSAWWTIAPSSDSSYFALSVNSLGCVGNYLVDYYNVDYSDDVRPSVYLKSNVQISGNGSTTYYTFS